MVPTKENLLDLNNKKLTGLLVEPMWVVIEKRSIESNGDITIRLNAVNICRNIMPIPLTNPELRRARKSILQRSLNDERLLSLDINLKSLEQNAKR